MDNHIRSLTSLRGVAALIVVIHHFAYYTLPPAGVFLSAHSYFFQNGYLCVDLFFILSGFIMTHVYLDRFDSGVTTANYGNYLRARFARIYPLHLFTLLLLVGLELFKLATLNPIAFTGKFNLTALFANLFLLQAFDLNCPPLLWCETYWNEPAWSISVEFVIYCIFPFGLFLLSKTKFRTNIFLYITTLISLLLLIKFTRGNLDTIIGIPSIARCGLECLLGIISYKFCRLPNSSNQPNVAPTGALTLAKHREQEHRHQLRFELLAIGAAISIGVIMHHWVDHPRVIHDWLILPAFSLLIIAMASHKTSLVSKLMNSPLLFYLGTRSYSIYLVHWCLAELLKTFWLFKFNLVLGNNISVEQSLIGLGLLIPIVLLAASLTYKFIEMPLRNAIRRSKLSLN